MRATTKIIGEGRVTIPATIRRGYDLELGDLVEIEVTPVREVEQ